MRGAAVRGPTLTLDLEVVVVDVVCVEHRRRANDDETAVADLALAEVASVARTRYGLETMVQSYLDLLADGP